MSENKGRPKSRRTLWLLRLLLLAGSGLFAVCTAEGVLRLFRSDDRFLPHHVNAHEINYPDEENMPGVSGVSDFTTNSLGCRGPEYDGQRLKLLTVGGSTTACMALDDEEAWPQLVMDRVNETRGESYLWVTNSGIDGRNSRHHIMHATYLVPKIEGLDYVLYYCGLNDLGGWLYRETFDPHYLDDPENWDEAIATGFRLSNYTSRDLPWYKHLELWKRASQIKSRWLSRKIQDSRERGVIIEDHRFEWLREQQAHRAAMEVELIPRAKRDTFGDALGEYERNLHRLIELTRQAGAEPIFVAQFTAWDIADEEAKKRFWMGLMNGGTAAIEGPEFQLHMDRYNVVMRDVAAAEGVPFIDLPAGLAPIRDDVTFDGCHFNEFGARETARVISDYLLENVLPE